MNGFSAKAKLTDFSVSFFCRISVKITHSAQGCLLMVYSAIVANM